MKVYSRSMSWALNKIIYIFIERVSINYYMIYNEIVCTFKVPFRLVEFRVGKQHLAINISTSNSSPVYTMQVLHPSLHSSFPNSSFLIVYTIKET